MLIKGNHLHYTYAKAQKPALQGVSLEIRKQEMVFFLGKSGSGKTTLLKCLMHLIKDYKGSLEYPQGMFKRGFVSQKFNLFPHMTVLENCIHPQIHILKRTKQEAIEKARELIASLEIEHLIDKYPSHLSGGQQQRVCLARALSMDVELLVLDEPTSALDPHATHQLKQLLRKLQKRGMTFIISTHDMDFVEDMKDKIYLMQGGEILAVHDASLGKLSSQCPIYHYLYRKRETRN